MRILLLLTTTLLISCSQPIGDPYKADCLTFWSQHKLDQEKLEFNVKLARKILARPRGRVGAISQMPLVHEKDFCATYGGAYILVREEEEWRCTTPTATNTTGECLGLTYRMGNSIEIGRSTNALGHELVHYVDTLNHIQTDDFHANWGETGRWEVDIEYTEGYKPLP